MMTRSHQLDDLGEQDGQFEIPFAEQARQLVLSHRVAAIGHRPRDHAQRDLLIGGWQKDGRCYQFRKLIKNKDPRCYEDTSSLSKASPMAVARDEERCQLLHPVDLKVSAISIGLIQAAGEMPQLAIQESADSWRASLSKVIESQRQGQIEKDKSSRTLLNYADWWYPEGWRWGANFWFGMLLFFLG